MSYDDFFDNSDFLIDPEDELNTVPEGGEQWTTGVAPDIFSSGEQQDIFNTRALVD